MNDLERAIGQRASTQHGLITAAQARRLGMERGQIRSRVETGRWRCVAPAVYRLAGVPESWQQVALAACLGSAFGAVASFLTAGALAALCPPPLVPHVTVGRGRSARSGIAVVHRARQAPAPVILQGVPCTDVARTLVDCAAILGPVRLQRMVDEAMHRRLVTVGRVEAALEASRLAPGRVGEGRLRETLEPWRTAIAAGSPAEHRLRMLLVQWGFPQPELQVPVVAVDGTVLGRLDCGWSHVRIGIEYDSERHHGQEAWASDLARQRAIEAEGWRIVRADKVDLRPGERRLRSDLDRIWAAARRAA
ncbi:MAG: hypothetical protein KF703_17285 [Actinobacteria bacterium]|nr:hypothetical protein [Actinomycetota bacterium]